MTAPYWGRLALSGGLFLCLLVATIAAFAPEPAGVTAATESRAVPAADRSKALLLAKGCMGCHTLSVPGDPVFRATGPLVGPSLTGIGNVAATRRPGMSAEAYLRESIVEPQAFVVPGYAASPINPGHPQMPKLPITREEADALIAFLLDPR